MDLAEEARGGEGRQAAEGRGGEVVVRGVAGRDAEGHVAAEGPAEAVRAVGDASSSFSNAVVWRKAGGSFSIYIEWEAH